MSIMALLTTMAITSYFSAISGMARRSAVKHIANTLILARQRACMEGTRVSVMLFNEFHGYKKDEDGKLTSEKEYIPSFVVCKALGKLSYVNGNWIADEFSDLNQMFEIAQDNGITDVNNYAGQIRLYNLTQGGWWTVIPFVEKVPPISVTDPYVSATSLGTAAASYELDLYGFRYKEVIGNAGSSKIGDEYGVEAAPVGSLPKGFAFENLDNENTVISINFLPDGRLDTSTGGKNKITIIETRQPSKRPSNSITIESGGAIDYKETWN